MAMVPVVECKIPTVTLSSSTFRPVVMIFALGKSEAFVVDFVNPGGVKTVAPLASVERSVAAGVAAVFGAAGSVEVAALDLLQPPVAIATHAKAADRAAVSAPREKRFRWEGTSCMGFSIL
jgi:hypothetical protein